MISPLCWRDIPYGDLDGWYSFRGDHANMHTAMYNSVSAGGNPLYQTYPLEDGAGPTWLSAHELEHRAVCASLGIAGPPDLSSFDLDIPDQYAEWMKVNADEHSRLNGVINLF